MELEAVSIIQMGDDNGLYWDGNSKRMGSDIHCFIPSTTQ